MRKILAFLLAVTLLAACNKTSNQTNAIVVADEAQQQIQSPQQINSIIQQVLNNKGEFNWSDA